MGFEKPKTDALGSVSRDRSGEGFYSQRTLKLPKGHQKCHSINNSFIFMNNCKKTKSS